MKPEDKVQGQIQQAPATKETVREQDKIMLVLSYLSLFALIPLLTVKDSELVKWHAKNGLVLGVGGLFVVGFISMIPFLNIIDCLLFPALTVIDVMAMVKALGGERWRIPVVSDIADKF